ncbi:ribose-5-phosphate isomerase [Pedobacter antarcticus]|nr:ribose-5-phosphate isomerase RpiA [Pedobacter antarcticus]SFF25984.1 ribose-5-phosphate isomerase [Pedobacter antarcticus]
MEKQMNWSEQEKKNSALEAVKQIKDHQIIGLGTGSTAFYAIQAVGELVKSGMSLQAVATSVHTENMAAELGIKLLKPEEVKEIDLTIDGADEFDSALNLIKGGGGALFREKIVASLSKKEIIIADSSKMVERLGKFKIPVEVVPFGLSYVTQQLKKAGAICYLRERNDKVFLTDNQNYIIDADFGLLDDPAALAEKLNQIEGVVAHGLFIHLATQVIMGKGDHVVIYDGN